MTVSINGNDIGEIVGIAITVASIVLMVLGAFLVWLMVRPSKRQRLAQQQQRQRPASDSEVVEMMRLIERMEDRLTALERIVDHESDAAPRLRQDREDRFLDAGVERPETRRTK